MSFQIETERLIIRDVREDDMPILIAQSAEPDGRKNILSYQADETYNKQALKNAIAWAKIPQREYYMLSVTLKTDQTLIGSCTIINARPECFETAVGWHYGSKYWGNGYATEVARELLYIGFELNEVNEIYADCFIENKASIRIMEKIGMSSSWNLGLFNMLRGWSYGESKPTVRYIISRNEWLIQINRRQ
ncbi:MAG: GNAT family N-acetyltransferase [Actinomycetota bacterium]